MKKSKGWIRDWFYVPKHEKVSDKSFLQIMLSSVFGILICGIFLAGITWAWFTSSITSPASNITSAKFSVQITFKQNEADVEPETDENGDYKLNGTYHAAANFLYRAQTFFLQYCQIYRVYFYNVCKALPL